MLKNENSCHWESIRGRLVALEGSVRRNAEKLLKYYVNCQYY